MSEEKDEFWDISKLVPKKKNTISSFVTKPISREFNVCGEKKDSKEQRLTENSVSPHLLSDTVKYERFDSLLKSISVSRFAEKFDFYSGFRNAALIYFDMKADECEFEPFFSYMPQYSQLNQAQRSYYLFWREEFRQGSYLKTDASYIYLLAYEIINLPDKIPPETGIISLITLWREYRAKIPAVNSHFCVWVQDYCLLHNLPVPVKEMSDFIFEAIAVSEFKEFYLSKLEYISEEATEAMLSFLSYYDWRRGKYAGGESRDIYKKHMLGAMRLLFADFARNGNIVNPQDKPEILTRNAFRGAVCSSVAKAKLSIEYFPISRNEALRSVVTEALRYTENQLRALLGVKSRLAVKSLDKNSKTIIDFYFSEIFSKLAKKRKEELKPEYEKNYDSTDEELSSASAKEIENISWLSTEKLVSEFEDQEESLILAHDETAMITEITAETQDEQKEDYGLSKTDVAFLKAILISDEDKIHKITEVCSELPEIVSERINTAFLEEFGDLVIDVSSGVPKIIEDYREDVEEWIKRLMK